MTRKELLEKRKRKKRNAKIKKIAIIAGGILLLLFPFLHYTQSVRPQSEKSKEGSSDIFG